LWLACGYAVIHGPAMPIVGPDNGDVKTANDTYVSQLVASAAAAVEKVCGGGGGGMGVCDRSRLAVGGHSYGAFMTANLLAHSTRVKSRATGHTLPLFRCGIARSGAYNRTMTPFGFQAEERTLWEAPEVCVCV
jgi:dipeptidyl aminopeptidase/acylaminoacyl peptidase